MGVTRQASPPGYGEGKKVRRARNIIRRYASADNLEPKHQARLERAIAIVSRAKLAGWV